jgi:hypothetical protein
MAVRDMQWLLILGLLAVACGSPPPDGGSESDDLSTEEVGPPVDSELSTEEDVKGALVVEGVAGVLPESYPRDLPLYQPSSLVDFGEGSGGSFVEFYSPSRIRDVKETLGRQLEDGGWELRDRVSNDWPVAREGRSATIRFTDARPGTTIRVDYR